MSSRNKKRLLRYLIVKTTSVRLGLKPGTLLRIRHRYALTETVYLTLQDILSILDLPYITLQQDQTSDLILFYHQDSLEKWLESESVMVFLQKQGYPKEREAQFSELITRCQNGSIAHEVGIFIGYPLKDVVGFISQDKPAVDSSCRYDWKIYGSSEESLRVMQQYRTAEAYATHLYDQHRQIENYLQAITKRTADHFHFCSFN